MDKALQEKLVQSLSQIADNVHESKHFVMSQMPDLIHQIFAYEIACGVTCILIFLVSALFVFLFPRMVKDYDFDKFVHGCPHLILIFTSGVSGIISIGYISKFFQMYFAPNLFILEYIKGLIH